MTPELAVLALRVLVAGLLYGFLAMVVIVSLRGLSASSRADELPAERAYRFLVVGTDPDVEMLARSFDLRPTTIIGRDPSCDVVLPDTTVSSTHTVVTRRDDAWWIEDAGSTNGTFVNQRAINRATKMSVGDVVQIGHVRLKLARK